MKIDLFGKNTHYVFDPQILSTKIGIGGMGVVYKGFDIINRKPVAIKVLFDNLANNEKVLGKTILTSRIRIKHNNLVEILDFIENDGIYHTVCEFLAGETLDKIIKSNKINSKQLSLCKSIMSDVLSGISRLHNNNPVIIHRDITPSNIMINHEQRAKIIDFGISRVLLNNQKSKKVTIVNNGSTIGTYHYSPPEQIIANYDAINQTSDIYSAGITFYELLSGNLPFNNENINVLMEMQMNSPLPKNTLIPNHLFKILQKATAKNQANRFQTVEEFSNALNSAKKSWFSWFNN
jgi:serine/threonine-protein kinase